MSFTILEKQITQMLRFIDNAEQNSNKNSQEKCFLVFSTKSEKIAIQQSHIINPLLTSFTRSVCGKVLPSVFIAQTSLYKLIDKSITD